MSLDRNQLEKILVSKWEYKKEQVADVVDKIFRMDPSLLASFETWMKTGSFAGEPAYSGLTPKIVYETCSFKPPAVFLFLDWVRKEPGDALKAMRGEFMKSA